MSTKSVWLGRFREPVRMAMLGSIGLTLLLAGYLILSKIFVADAIGMHQMIRPQEAPIAGVFLILMSIALFTSSVYMSDTLGPIEVAPQGPFDYLSLIVGRLAMLSIAFVVIVMFYEVVSRYVFSRPTLWANELSLWIAAFVFLLAGLYAMQQRSHIRIYVIYNIMPRWAQKTADVISVALIVGFCFALIWGGFNDAYSRMMRLEGFGTAWDPPLPGTVKPAILFLIFLVSIQAVSNLILDWNKDPESFGGSDDIDETEIENLRKTLEGK